LSLRSLARTEVNEQGEVKAVGLAVEGDKISPDDSKRSYSLDTQVFTPLTLGGSGGGGSGVNVMRGSSSSTAGAK
ncbi:MAG: hypothetical protein OQJ76_04155, partial [Rhodospirillales bacterium]|nr:hypothetical protein [Rhodospirillales bacterium]